MTSRWKSSSVEERLIKPPEAPQLPSVRGRVRYVAEMRDRQAVNGDEDEHDAVIAPYEGP